MSKSNNQSCYLIIMIILVDDDDVVIFVLIIVVPQTIPSFSLNFRQITRQIVSISVKFNYL